jgi:acyl-CoA oxidase
MIMGGTKLMLLSMLRYANQRLCVGPTGLSDMAIMEYQLLQNAIFPLLARSVVMCLALNYVKDVY